MASNSGLTVSTHKTSGRAPKKADTRTNISLSRQAMYNKNKLTKEPTDRPQSSPSLHSTRSMPIHGSARYRKPQTTAAGNVSYYENSRDEMEASAQIFVDDKEIIECIPFLTGDPEKAWHVRYNPGIDNEMFGADANNDATGGVELCYDGSTDLPEAYKRYAWVLA